MVREYPQDPEQVYVLGKAVVAKVETRVQVKGLCPGANLAGEGKHQQALMRSFKSGLRIISNRILQPEKRR